MMNVSTISTGTSSTQTQHNATTTMGGKTYKIEMIDDSQLSIASDDDDDDIISSEGSMYGDGDLAAIAVNDDVANQLAAAGPVGVAAAAAIASSKKRKRPHSFETNPSVRKRQQNRLLRKLRGIIYEFTGRVGKQAVVLVATPGKPNTSYKVFGAKPLEDVVRNLKNIVMDELENALAQQAPPPPQEDPSLFELPGLVIDGIPTPVEKMTQAQLRAFIPLMLKYSTGRGKPGWGRESTRPPWWPKELPWANVRMDARSEDDKQKISWTHALRKIVINCYKYHGREDLLPTFADEDEKVNALISQSGDEDEDMELPTTATIQNVQTVANASTNTTNYTQTVLSTIQNADGTVSLIQVDPNNPIITLPDGTTAQVQGVATLHQGEGGATIQTVQSLADVNGHENMTVDLTEATVAQDGQIYITTEDGQGYPVSVSNMITVPVSASMYQSMMANIQQIHSNNDGTVCITPMQVDSNSNTNSTSNNNNNQNHNTHYQCYSILSTTPAATSTSSSSSSSNNNNNNNNSSNSSTSNSTNSNNQMCQNVANHNNNNSNNNNARCQIFNQNNLSKNSSQTNQHHHQQQQHAQLQQQQQQQQQHTQLPSKFYLAAAVASGNSNFNLNHSTNNNNNNNNNNNTNNNNNNNNNNIKMTLPIIVAATGPTGLAGTGSAAATSKRSNNKRRKQSFAKVLPIKLEEHNLNTTNSNASEEFLNIQLVDSNNIAATPANMLPIKAIKLENLDN